MPPPLRGELWSDNKKTQNIRTDNTLVVLFQRIRGIDGERTFVRKLARVPVHCVRYGLSRISYPRILPNEWSPAQLSYRSINKNEFVRGQLGHGSDIRWSTDQRAACSQHRHIIYRTLYTIPFLGMHANWRFQTPATSNVSKFSWTPSIPAWQSFPMTSTYVLAWDIYLSLEWCRKSWYMGRCIGMALYYITGIIVVSEINPNCLIGSVLLWDQ